MSPGGERTFSGCTFVVHLQWRFVRQISPEDIWANLFACRPVRRGMGSSFLSVVNDAHGCISRRLIFLRLPQLPIIQQLLLEESIYRRSKSFHSVGWVLYNDYTKSCGRDGSSRYSVILGRSQKPREMVYPEPVLHDSIPLVRRYSVSLVENKQS